MRALIKKMRTKLKDSAYLIMVLFFLVGISCLPSVETKQAKVYEAQLLSLHNETEAKVLPMVEKEWKFELLRIEKITGLSPSKIKELLPRGIRFSEEEIKTIFSEPGAYKLLIYIKEIGASAATTGEITDLGLSATKDTAYTVKHYSLIRLVFKEDKLLHSRVWPRIDSSQLAEGVIRIK